MRRICWYALALLFILSLAGCDMPGENDAQSQPAVHATSLPQTRGDGDVMEPGQFIPESTATPTATAIPSPTPTARPTVHPTPTVQNSGTSSSGTSLEKQLQQQLFALINQDRAREGLYTYILNGTLSAGALLHSKTMSSCGMSHQCAGEASPCQRISNEGISWTSCGENVGYTSPNPTDWEGVKKIEQAMLAEQPPDDGHRRNLLNTSFHRVGIGIYIDASGLVWITEDFAS